ncbi:c-type cytochrome [Pseudoroseicyclus sp. H15]
MRLAPSAILLCGLNALAAPAAAQDAARGAALFDENCAACHQAGGIGQPGLAPPLVDAPLWEGLGDDAPTYFGSVVLGGLTGRITAGGVMYIGVAMPRHDWLEDDEIVDLAAYVLGELNGLEPELDADTLAGLRAAPLDGSAIHALREGALE